MVVKVQSKKGMRCQCFMGIEFQLGKINILEIDGSDSYTTMRLYLIDKTVYLNIIKMANFILYIFYHYRKDKLIYTLYSFQLKCPLKKKLVIALYTEEKEYNIPYPMALSISCHLGEKDKNQEICSILPLHSCSHSSLFIEKTL